MLKQSVCVFFLVLLICLDDFRDGCCDWKPVLDADVLDRRGDDGDFEIGLEDQSKDIVGLNGEKGKTRIL